MAVPIDFEKQVIEIGQEWRAKISRLKKAILSYFEALDELHAYEKNYYSSGPSTITNEFFAGRRHRMRNIERLESLLRIWSNSDDRP